MTKNRLGELLVSLGYVSTEQLEGLLATPRGPGALGRAVVKAGLCSEEQVLEALSFQRGLPWIDLDAVDVSPEAVPLLPRKFARENQVVPLRTRGEKQDVLLIAVAAPASEEVLEAVRTLAGKAQLEVYLATDTGIERALARIDREQPMLPDVRDVLTLSSTALGLLEGMAKKHGMTINDVVSSVVERWASSRSRPLS